MSKIRLKDIDTRASKQLDKEKTKKDTAEILEELDELQNLLYAESRHSLLIIIQAMDAGGKDGLIRNVFGKLNPQGVEVKSFKVPTAEEAAHVLQYCAGFLLQKEKYFVETRPLQMQSKKNQESRSCTGFHFVKDIPLYTTVCKKAGR